MISNRYLHNQVLAEYVSLQSKANQRLQAIEEQKLKNSDYADIKYKLNGVIFDYEKAKFLNDKPNISRLEKLKNDLTSQIATLNKQFSASNENSVYECQKCLDSPHLKSGEYCHCFYEKLTKLAYDYLEVKQTIFSTFDQSKADKNGKEYPIKLDKFISYAKKFNLNSKSLFISGQVGVGKTFCAEAIANEVQKLNYNVIFLTAYQLNNVLLKIHLAPSYEKINYLDILTTCDLLIIDDLGTEPTYKNVTNEYLLSIINERTKIGKPFIITTNLTPSSTFERYGERLYSRFKNKNCVVLNFDDTDRR